MFALFININAFAGARNFAAMLCLGLSKDQALLLKEYSLARLQVLKLINLLADNPEMNEAEINEIYKKINNYNERSTEIIIASNEENCELINSVFFYKRITFERGQHKLLLQLIIEELKTRRSNSNK